MKKKYNEMTTSNRIMLIVRIIVSICVLIFAALQIFGVWDKAIHLAVPLVGIVLLIQSIQEWKQQRGVAIFGFCVVLFIFFCTFVVWFV